MHAGMLSDDAVKDGACLARNSLFTLLLKTSKSYGSGNTLAGRAFHSLAVSIRMMNQIGSCGKVAYMCNRDDAL